MLAPEHESSQTAQAPLRLGVVVFEAYFKERISSSSLVVSELYVRWSGQELWSFVGDTRKALDEQRVLQFLFNLLLIDEDPPVPARV